jgi:hypothetical protein
LPGWQFVYQELLLLKERLNPSRIPQKEVQALEVA